MSSGPPVASKPGRAGDAPAVGSAVGSTAGTAGARGTIAAGPPRLRLAAGTRRLGAALLVGGVPTRLLRLAPAGVAELDAALARGASAHEGGERRERASASAGARARGDGPETARGQGPGGGQGGGQGGAADAPRSTLATRRLVDRLVASGLAFPCPPSAPELRELRLPSTSVVVPVRDDPEGLARTLESLAEPPAHLAQPVVVVDDGSRAPAEIEAVVGRWPGVRLRRRPAAGGPAAARNDGWRTCATDLVAFVDAGCIATPGWVEPLAWHLRDPAVGAVAPRIAARPVPDATESTVARRIGRYEETCSPLDLGPDPGPVGPGQPIGYVPTTALVVRRQALVELGGLEETLRFGEDVDLVWRLGRAGWSVRYEPSVVLSHPPRRSLAAFCRQRAGYASAAGPLDRRHPGALSPVVATLDAVTPLALAVLAGSAPALAAVAVSAARLESRLGSRSRRPTRRLRDRVTERTADPGLRSRVGARLVAPRLVVANELRVLELLDRAAWSAWLPLTLTAAVRLSARRGAACPGWAPLLTFAFGPTLAWLRDRPPLDLPTYVALRRLDGLATGVGLWAGALRAHRFGPLLPRLGRRSAARG